MAAVVIFCCADIWSISAVIVLHIIAVALLIDIAALLAMSLVLEKAPELFTAYLHCSSRWDGDYAPVVENRLPVYLAVGEGDEYYSSEPTREAYDALRNLYLEQGLSEAEIDRLLVLDIKDSSYFTERGISNQHGGGAQFAFDEEIMGWLFEQT